jgi:hypothetical protein
MRNLPPIQRREIPVLPERPCTHPISNQIRRSYPVGRQSFSRASQDELWALTVTVKEGLPQNVQARLISTLNATGGHPTTATPFVRRDERTLACPVTPERSGLYTFRAEFSLDGGLTWLRDTVPDAWVLVDPPQVDGLRLYTLIPSASGSVADWAAELTRIRGMGFNAVHLLPVTPRDASDSPYAARDLFDIDRGYLAGGVPGDGLSQLEGFIAAARALDVRLCFDLVLNHVGAQSTMAHRAPDWIVPDQTEANGLKRALYWSGQARHIWEDLVLINYEHPSQEVRAEIWEYMTDYALFWAGYAAATGGFVRFDNLHSSDRAFVQALTIALHAEYPELAILAEYFTDGLTLLDTVPDWGLNLVLATPWDDKFVPELREYLREIHRVSEHVRYFMPVTSQDSGAPAQEFGTSAATVPRYVAAALLGTGATGIPQGVEWGELERIDFIGRRPKTLHSGEPKFAPFLSRVNAILASHPAFRRGGNCRFVDGGHPAVIAAFRQDPEANADGFLVVCNFDTHSPQSVTVDLAEIPGLHDPFPCRDLLSGVEQSFPHPRLDLLLPPCTAQVLMFTTNKETMENTS